MSRYVFGSQELSSLLRQESRRFTTGYLWIHFRSPEQLEANETWLLAFYQGRLIFSGGQPLSCKVFLQRLSRFIPRLQLGWSQRAIRVIRERLMREDSIPALIEGMIQLALLRPGEVEEALWNMLMTDFDNYLYTLAGTCRFEVHDILDRERPINGFELDTVLHNAAQRQDKWSELKMIIPTMLAIPLVNWERLENSQTTEEQRQRLHTLTKDRLPLESIASKLCRDRLDIAQTFAGWIRKGLVTLQIPQELKQVQSKVAVKTILAVDDSIVMQEVVRQSLSTYRVITTGNPSEVLNLIFQYHPDLVVMDVCMPGIDGIELCRIIRGLEEFKSIPIIMLTARDGLLDRVRGTLSGATRYMTKPIDEAKLNLEVERLLSQRVKPLRPLAHKPEVNEWPAYNASSGL